MAGRRTVAVVPELVFFRQPACDHRGIPVGATLGTIKPPVAWCMMSRNRESKMAIQHQAFTTRPLSTCALLAAILVLFSIPGKAQVATGTINITVADATG